MRAVPFLEGFRAIADGTRLLVAPEALSRFYDGTLSPGAHKNASVVASWMTRDERESEIADYLAYLDTVHATITSRLGGAKPIVTVLGFSQGGATAARWVASGRVPAARLVVWGSAMAPELDVAAPDDKARLPVEDELGDAAAMVAGEDGAAVMQRLVHNEPPRLAVARQDDVAA